MTSTKPTDPLTSSGPETKKVTALKLELKQLREQLKESCGRLPEKEQHLFAADCAERGHSLFGAFLREDQRLLKVIELRRQWANGEASDEAWRVAQDLARQIAQEVPIHDLSQQPSPNDLVRRHVKACAVYLAQAAVAGPYDAALFAASALFLFIPNLSRYEEDIRWQWDRVQQYLQGVVRKPKVRKPQTPQERARSLQRFLKTLDHALEKEDKDPSDELAEEISRLEILIGLLSSKLNKQDQHRFAVDCVQRSLPLFECQFPGYPQPGEALRLRRLFAEQQISEQAWLVATDNVIRGLEPLRPKKHQEEVCLAAYATIADPATAASFSVEALLACTEDPTSRETEVRWQWEQCLHYFRHGISPEPQPEAMAIEVSTLRERMPAFLSWSYLLPDELPSQNEQIELLCFVLSEREQHLFIADCAERVLPRFEGVFPDDKRPREAIRLRRLFAENKIVKEEWRAAVMAAYDAKEDIIDAHPPKERTPAQNAAVAAACTTFFDTSETEKATRCAATALKSDPKAVDTEREWQLTRLFHYLRRGPTSGSV